MSEIRDLPADVLEDVVKTVENKKSRWVKTAKEKQVDSKGKKILTGGGWCQVIRVTEWTEVCQTNEEGGGVTTWKIRNHVYAAVKATFSNGSEQQMNFNTLRFISKGLAMGARGDYEDSSHLCGNKACVRQNHVVAESHSENMKRRRAVSS
jgi:hypothetical protein